MKQRTSKFINYAHRGASEYAPENTFLSFYLGIYQGANGIETDVQMTKDGVLILFHDDTITRLTGEEGRVAGYTLEELKQFTFERNGLKDKIVVFEEFLKQFLFRDMTFAIEIKQAGIEKQVADLIRQYHAESKVVITSFMLDSVIAVKNYAPELQAGLLKVRITEEDMELLQSIGVEEVCPKAVNVTAENVAVWHEKGFRVRAWGVENEELMRKVYDSGADGMTVNFPDKLTEYMRK